MLTITVPAAEFYDESAEEFITTAETQLVLEHSLISLSKWESSWEKPFLGDDKKTDEETIDYVRCMNLTPDVDPNIFRALTNGNVEAINKHIGAKMTATWFNERPGPPGRKQTITSELIYSWMVSLTIDFEVQHWHLARLLVLIKVCNEQNKAPDKKSRMNPKDLAERNRMLNEKRKAELKSAG